MMLDIVQKRSRYERIIGFLAGPGIVDVPAIDSPKALVRSLRRGLPVDSTVFARDHLGLTPVVFDRVLPRTTIASAEKSVSRPLSTAASETLFRLSRLTAIAEEAYGDAKRAHHWLADPNPVFDNEAPAEFADTEAGAEWVESVLGRLMRARPICPRSEQRTNGP